MSFPHKNTLPAGLALLATHLRAIGSIVLMLVIAAACASAQQQQQQQQQQQAQEHPQEQPQKQEPAPPERDPLNRQLPDWLTLGFHERLRFEGYRNIRFDPERDDAYMPVRLRFRLGIRPSKNFRLFFETQDSRVGLATPGLGLPNGTDQFDLRRAQMVIGNEKQGWWDLSVGRQELVFGTERLIGINVWSNVSRSYDAVKVAIHHGGNRVDIFSASVPVVAPDDFDRHVDGDNIHGIYGSLGRFIPGVLFEPHVFYRMRPRVTDERGFRGDADVFTYGVRLASKIDGPWDFQTEMDWQRGSVAQDDQRAFMGLWGIGYTARGLRFKPRFPVEYTYASGDSERGDGKIGTFEQIYARAHRVWGIADMVGGRNAKMLMTGVHLRLTPKSRLRLDHHFFWLASRRDGLYRNSGSLLVPAPAGGAKSAYIGHEFDVQFDYEWSQYLTCGTGVAHMFAGGFLKETTPGASTTYPYIFLEFEL